MANPNPNAWERRIQLDLGDNLKMARVFVVMEFQPFSNEPHPENMRKVIPQLEPLQTICSAFLACFSLR